VLGAETFRDYIADVVPRVGVFRDHWMNASITGWFNKLFDSPSPQVTPLVESPMLAKAGVVIASLLVAAAVALVARRAEGRTERDHAFALTILGMLLVSPVTWNHYFLFLLLPILLWWPARPSAPDRIMVAAVYFLLIFFSPAWVWLLVFPPGTKEVVFSPDDIQAVAVPLDTLTVLSIQFYALLGLFAWGLFVARRQGQLPQTQST
jgi:hypothetical protein